MAISGTRVQIHEEPKSGDGRRLRLPELLDVFVALLAVAFASQRFLGPAAFAGLQVKGVSFDLLDNIFLLDLTLESAECALECFTFLHKYFGQ